VFSRCADTSLTDVGERELADEWERSEDEVQRQVDAEVERDVDQRSEPEDEPDTAEAQFRRSHQRIDFTRIRITSPRVYTTSRRLVCVFK